MALPAFDGPSLTVLLAGLALAAAHVAWWAPRLSQRAAWGVAAAIAAALLIVSPWLGQPLAAAMVAVAFLFGQFGRSLGAGPPPRDAAEPASAGPAAPMPAAAVAPASGGTPATLGRYRIDSEIGRGSMGAVYLGRDPQIGRAVAIKTMALSRGFGQDNIGEARERFFREAETAGRLHHPDIVTIFDAGESGELAWIAMEYVKGEDLQRHTAPGRLLPAPQVLEIVARVAEALSYAHAQGVVHRDIKPANVMVGLDTGLVKVMDFGVARVDDASRTRTGIVLGTPSYMSPEQMAGRRTDGRSDLYSLGVMLFQLLTGRLPHEGENMAELMRRIVNEPAPDIRSQRPELPEALADVVALALEKRPEVRYADGVQMAQDLRAVAAALAAPSPPSSTPNDEFEKTVTFSRNDPRHNSAS
jgi:serine/threonine-protein kinase